MSLPRLGTPRSVSSTSLSGRCRSVSSAISTSPEPASPAATSAVPT